MDATRRVVTNLPLAELWDEHGAVLTAQPTRKIGAEDVKQLLRDRPELKFVVADVGSPLEWIDAAARFSFWKAELAPHLADPARGGAGTPGA